MERSDYPWLYRASDRASDTAQRWYFRALCSQLALFLTVSLLAAIPTWIVLSSPQMRGFSITIAVLLAVGLVVFGAVREKKFDKRWFDARAVAESAKTLTWRYMMRIPPFQRENATAEQLLIDELQAVSSSRSSSARDLGGLEKDKTQVSKHMRAVRASTFEERKAYFLASRVSEEREWYHDKTAANRRKSDQFYWAVLGVQLLALIWAVLRASSTVQMAPTGPLMTLAASFSAWTLAKRHDDLATTYSVTADELTNLEQKVELCSTEAEFIGYVEDVEEAISREHTMWRARRNAGI